MFDVFFLKILIYFDDFFKHFFHRSVPSCLKALPFCCTAVRTTWREIHHLLLMKSRVSTNFDTLRHTYESFLFFFGFHQFSVVLNQLETQKNLGSEVCLWVIFQCCAAALQQQTISLDGQQQKLSVSTPCLHRAATILCFRYFRYFGWYMMIPYDYLWPLTILYYEILWIFQISIALWEVQILIIL